MHHLETKNEIKMVPTRTGTKIAILLVRNKYQNGVRSTRKKVRGLNGRVLDLISDISQTFGPGGLGFFSGLSPGALGGFLCLIRLLLVACLCLFNAPLTSFSKVIGSSSVPLGAPLASVWHPLGVTWVVSGFVLLPLESF